MIEFSAGVSWIELGQLCVDLTPGERGGGGERERERERERDGKGGRGGRVSNRVSE